MEEYSKEHKEQIDRKLRFLGIAYRVLLIVGIVLFLVTAIMAVLTVKITIWHLGIPLEIFLLGILLARMEYNLFRRS